MDIVCSKCGNTDKFNATYWEIGRCQVFRDTNGELGEFGLNPLESRLVEAECTVCGNFIPLG